MAAGLPRDEVWDVLTMKSFAMDVDEDWFRARQLGVSAVPFYLYGDEPLVGYRPFEDLLQLVDAT